MSLFLQGNRRHLTLHHLLTSGPSAVHKLTSCEVKSCLFVRNKSINKNFFTLKCFRAKIKSPFHNIDGLDLCGLLWCFYQLFGLSFWHPLAPIHCRASIREQVMEYYISPNLFSWRKNSSTTWMAFAFTANFHFWVNYSFKIIIIIDFF